TMRARNRRSPPARPRRSTVPRQQRAEADLAPAALGPRPTTTPATLLRRAARSRREALRALRTRERPASAASSTRPASPPASRRAARPPPRAARRAAEAYTGQSLRARPLQTRV